MHVASAIFRGKIDNNKKIPNSQLIIYCRANGMNMSEENGLFKWMDTIFI